MKGMHGKLDLFICSYTLHHISNGNDLRYFLSGDAKFRRDIVSNVKLRNLGGAGDQQRKAFKEDMLKGLEKAKDNLALLAQLEGLPAGPARAMLSLLMPYNLCDWGDRLRDYLDDKFDPREKSCLPSELADLIRNPQAEIVQLLAGQSARCLV